MFLLAVGLFSFFLTLILVKLALKFFPVWGLMDRPHKYGLKRAPIPYYGGIVIVLAFVVSVLIWVPLDMKVMGFLLGGILVAVVSFIDDRKGLSPYIRLLTQVIAGLVLYFSGIFLTSLPGPWGGELVLIPVVAAVLTVVWVVLVMNTFNWIDGLNGLPSGVSTIASLVILGLAMRPGLHAVDQNGLIIMALILAMVCLVFWFYDFHPAKILMGDTGSMFLGYALAALAIFAGGKLATAFLVLGFPILDAFWVILRRIFSGKSPFKGDLQHFHHRLSYAGLSHRMALILIYTFSALFGFLAIWLGTQEKIWAIVILLSTMAIVGFGVVLMEIEKKRKRG